MQQESSQPGIWLQSRRACAENCREVIAAGERDAVAAGKANVAKLMIGMLTAILLVVLYRGMQREQAKLDPTTPPDIFKIQAVIRSMNFPCDVVESFTPLGKSKEDHDSYLARCRDGGRYVYFQDAASGRLNVTSCAFQAQFGYRCPK